MKNPYKTREGGATVTIFVPYDCKNNCPFCINKEEYADMTGFSVEKICEAVRGASLIGKGSEILMDIDMVGQNLATGQGMCGSSSGSVPTDVGQPLIRVSKITVGGR